MIDKARYTDLGTFENKQKAMKFRNDNHRWCSCYTEKEKSKTRLWVKLPNMTKQEQQEQKLKELK